MQFTKRNNVVLNSSLFFNKTGFIFDKIVTINKAILFHILNRKNIQMLKLKPNTLKMRPYIVIYILLKTEEENLNFATVQKLFRQRIFFKHNKKNFKVCLAFFRNKKLDDFFTRLHLVCLCVYLFANLRFILLPRICFW